MIRLLVVLSLLVPYASRAAEPTSNDFADGKNEKSLTRDQILEQFSLSGQFFILSTDGTKLVSNGAESRTWKFPPNGTIFSNWSYGGHYEGKNIFSIKHVWTLNPSGEIEVLIEQYESMKGNMPKSTKVVYGRKIREQKFVLKDFAPVVWEVSSNDKEKVVVHLIPKLNAPITSIESIPMPVVFKDAIVTDAKNRVWADDLTTEAKYVSFRCHLGQVALSYLPFKGAAEIGYAEGNLIKIKTGAAELKIRSRNDFFAMGQRMKIYGIIDSTRKSEGPGSVYMGASNTEANFVDYLKQ